MKPPIVALIAALPLFAAEPLFFVQTTDPQFGMFTNNANFRQETTNWEYVISNVNRLKPRFLIVCGDLTNAAGNADQIAEYKRINAKLDPAVHLYNVPGNHDVGNEPTPATIAAYRRAYGNDYYSFQEGRLYGIVLNSSLLKSPAGVKEEAAAQERWLEEELGKAKSTGAMPVIFQHIPFFLEKPDEPDQYFNLPIETRRRVLALLHRFGVHYVFAGHYHRNSFGRDGDLEMITSGPAGMPIGPDASGMRIAEVKNDAIGQRYYPFGTIPNVYPIPAPAGK